MNDDGTTLGALWEVTQRLRIASEQWAHKSPEDQAVERRFIERDYRALTGCNLTAFRNG